MTAPGDAVRAAGGVVLRTVAGATAPTEVLVVHRPGYDDWSLPKGKLDPGEDDATAAVREVTEETGVVARIVGDAGSVEYVDRRNRFKVVRYFMMEPTDETDRAPDDEVDEVEWWPTVRALADLTYPRDRELLRAVTE